MSPSRKAWSELDVDLTVRLVVMLVHLFYADGLDRPTVPHNVDGSVSVAQTYGTVALPLALEGMVSEAGNRSGRFESVNAHEVHPERELSSNVDRDPDQLFSGLAREFDVHSDSVPQPGVRSRSRSRAVTRGRRPTTLPVHRHDIPP